MENTRLLQQTGEQNDRPQREHHEVREVAVGKQQEEHRQQRNRGKVLGAPLLQARKPASKSATIR